MKICLIGPGDSIHLHRWANFFAQREHEVHVICPKIAEGFDESVHVHLLDWTISSRKYLKLVNAPVWLYQMRKTIKKMSPDIVDGHFLIPFGYFAALSNFHPFVLTAWGSDILLAPKKSRLFRAFHTYSLRKADTVFYNSAAARAMLVELGAPLSKLRFYAHGVDTSQFNPSKRNASLKLLLDASETSPIIICIRSLQPIYNHTMLFQAIPRVLKHNPETIFIIGGDGILKESLINMGSRLGVSKSLRFVGQLEHPTLATFLASSDVYVSTSFSDSTSLSLQEAMSCELAPVVTDVPGNMEWVTDGKNGFVVHTNEVEMLAQKIIDLLQDQNKRHEFGKRCRKIILSRADYYTEMEKVETHYASLVSKHRSVN